MRTKLIMCLMIATASVASMAKAAIVNYAVAPPGHDNIAFGYGSGYRSGGDSTNVVVIGTEAGMYSTNNNECVFIGANAGKGMSNKTGAVVIGNDVFIHTNGVTTIKGFNYNRAVTFRIINDTTIYIYTNNVLVGRIAMNQ